MYKFIRANGTLYNLAGLQTITANLQPTTNDGFIMYMHLDYGSGNTKSIKVSVDGVNESDLNHMYEQLLLCIDKNSTNSIINLQTFIDRMLFNKKKLENIEETKKSMEKKKKDK